MAEDLNDLKKISENFRNDLDTLSTDQLFIKYLGKKGKINKLLTLIKDLPKEEKIELAKKINTLKAEIQDKIENEKQNITSIRKDFEKIDLSVPTKSAKIGHLHPITIVTKELYNFFHYYGFSVSDGPEIEDDYHNFEMLGVPQDHPARALQDTLYILEPEILLRTQASSVEARELERQNPPIRFVFAGKVYRNETANKSNAAFFHHFQGVYVDKHVTLGHLKWILTKSLKYILGEDIQIRFRAKYYPEVEPGLSPDIKCTFCKGTGCDVCKHRGWIEIAGAGMIHPATLEKAEINSEEYSGFAFGWGLDRIAMARYDIRDIRVLFDGSLIYK